MPVTAYAYDAAGNLLRDGRLGPVTAFAYDELGRTISQTGPYLASEGPEDVPVSQYAYDKAGNVVSVTDLSGNTTPVRVRRPAPPRRGDPARPRRQRSAQFPRVALDVRRGRAADLQTDAQGNVTTYQYDGLGRKIRETAPDPDGAGPKVGSGDDLRLRCGGPAHHAN